MRAIALACGKNPWKEGWAGRRAPPSRTARYEFHGPDQRSFLEQRSWVMQANFPRRARGGAELIPMIPAEQKSTARSDDDALVIGADMFRLGAPLEKPAHDMPANPQQQNKNENMCPKAPPKAFTFRLDDGSNATQSAHMQNRDAHG